MPQQKIFHWEVFEVDTGSGHLGKSGIRLRLEKQPLLTLLLLMERSGKVVSREEL